MKKLIAPVLFALFLTACGNVPTTLTYDVTFTTEDPGRMTDLSLATRHVIERRLARLEGNLIDYDIDYDEESQVTTIGVRVDNANAAEALNEEMTAPFTFEVRYLVKEFQEGDIDTETVGIFRATGINKSHVDWVIGQTTEPPLNRGRVLIGFTDESQEQMQTLFTEQKGNTIGLFVRDRLTAAVSIDKDFEKVLVIGHI